MFYSGGFLFDPTTNLILLHKRDGKTSDNPNLWAFFGGNSEGDEKPLDTFTREIREELGIEIKNDKIHTLRNYFNPDFNTHRNVFYAEFDSTLPLNLTEGENIGWFPLNEAFKLNLSKRTREDLTYFQESKN